MSVGEACYFLLNVVSSEFQGFLEKLAKYLSLLFSFECCLEREIAEIKERLARLDLLFSFECCIATRQYICHR